MKYRRTLVGLIVGRLTILEKIHNRGDGSTDTKYLCSCSCGTVKILRYCNLIGKSTNSCGCLQKELLSKKNRKEKGHACKTAIFNYYKRNASDRDLMFSIDKQNFIDLILGPCHYCGIIGYTHTVQRYGDELYHNGVDRKDNSVGYTVENSVTCCKICNRAKGNLTISDFQKWINVIRDRNNNVVANQ